MSVHAWCTSMHALTNTHTLSIDNLVASKYTQGHNYTSISISVNKNYFDNLHLPTMYNLLFSTNAVIYLHCVGIPIHAAQEVPLNVHQENTCNNSKSMSPLWKLFSELFPKTFI